MVLSLAGTAAAQTQAEKAAAYIAARRAAWKEALTGQCSAEFRQAVLTGSARVRVTVKHAEEFSKCFEPYRQGCRSACGSDHGCVHECLDRPNGCEDNAAVRRAKAALALAALADDAATVAYQRCAGKPMPEPLCPAQWDDPAATCV